jgi:hypothetical protein
MVVYVEAARAGGLLSGSSGAASRQLVSVRQEKVKIPGVVLRTEVAAVGRMSSASGA